MTETLAYDRTEDYSEAWQLGGDVDAAGDVPPPTFGPVTVQWYAHSYGRPDGRDLETFETISHALDTLERRTWTSDTHYPLFGDGLHVLIWAGELEDVTDVYPQWEATWETEHDDRETSDHWTLAPC